MHTETILYIILAGIIALSLALFQYLYASKTRTKLNISLTVLRFLTLFAVFILLINPKFERVTFINTKPQLLVAIDNSESVAYLNHDKKTRAIVVSMQGNKDLNRRFDVSYFSFGKEVKALDSLRFDEKQTNPTLLFERLSEIYDDAVAPLVILTDGNQTYGNDYEFTAKNYKHPIFPIILGDTITYADLKIEQLNTNKYAYLNNKFPVEIIVVYNGNEDIITQLDIYSGTTAVFSEKLSLSKEQSSQLINLHLPANQPGVHSYKAEIKPIPNEQNTVNNVKNFAIDVIDRKTNVAIISDIIHPDLGALKKAIESNDQRQAMILEPSEFLKISDDFQQVILYQPNQKFSQIYDAIQKLNINAFTIVGSKTDWNQFNKLQPYVQQNITNQQEEFQAAINLNYNAFIVDDIGFAEFSPLHTEFGATTFTIPHEVILYKMINGIELKEPLLVTYEVDQERSVLLNGEGIWRWRAQSYLKEKSFQDFDDFIGKIIQYLDNKQKRSRLNVNFESFYMGNDDVILTAQYFNKNYEFDKSGNLEITLQNQQTNEAQTLPFILKQSSFQVDLSGLEAGDYNFTVKVQNELHSVKGEFKILDYNVEQQFLNANVSKLQNLATNSVGTSYFIDNTKALTEQLLSDDRFVTIQKSIKNSVPLIDWKFLLAFIVTTLSLEWFIRKYHGLI